MTEGALMLALEIPDWAQSGDQLAGWTKAVLVAGGGLALSRVVRVGIRRVLSARIDAVVADLIGRLVSYLVVALTFVYTLAAVGINIGPIIGALGIAGIALAFALQDVLENFVAGILLQIRRPFKYDDEITTGSSQGTVKSVDARSVTIFTPDGETVQLPASLVNKAPLINHSRRGARRSEIAVGVAYSTKLDEAIELLTDAAAQTEGVLGDPPPQTLVTGFGDSSIDLLIRFWHEPSIMARGQIVSRVALAIERATRVAGIEIPFPQQVIIGSSTSFGQSETKSET